MDKSGKAKPKIVGSSIDTVKRRAFLNLGILQISASFHKSQLVFQNLMYYASSIEVYCKLRICRNSPQQQLPKSYRTVPVDACMPLSGGISGDERKDTTIPTNKVLTGARFLCAVGLWPRGASSSISIVLHNARDAPQSRPTWVRQA